MSESDTEDMEDEIIEDFVEPGPEGVPENASSEPEKPKEEKKSFFGKKKEVEPEVPKETSRPSEKTVDLPKAKKPSVINVSADMMTTNASGVNRPMVELRNGRVEPLTRKLLVEINDYDERGKPNHELCEEVQKVERLEKLLTLWEAGVHI